MHVTSKDGSRIAYWRQGRGEPVVCLGGALDDGSENQPLAEVLAQRFDVVNYSRRGRGGSTDRSDSTLRDELIDLDAIAKLFDRPPHLFGASSGGALALRAAIDGMPINRIAVYEVPFDPFPGAEDRQAAYVARLHAYLDAGDNDGALANFMRLAGASEKEIEAGPSHPEWQRSAALAPSLRHDAEVLGNMRPPLSELKEVSTPILFLTGGLVPLFEGAADAMSGAAPNGLRRVLEGQSHVADPEFLGRVVSEWLDA